MFSSVACNASFEGVGRTSISAMTFVFFGDYSYDRSIEKSGEFESFFVLIGVAAAGLFS